MSDGLSLTVSLMERVRRKLGEQKQLLSNIAWQGAAQIGARVLNLTVFVVIANVLGADGLGRFVFAVTFAQVAGVFVDFGMQPILVREAVKGEAWGLFRTFSRLKILLSLAVGAAGLWRVLGDRAYREELGAAGMERAARFSWDEAARRTRQIYTAVGGDGEADPSTLGRAREAA